MPRLPTLASRSRRRWLAESLLGVWSAGRTVNALRSTASAFVVPLVVAGCASKGRSTPDATPARLPEAVELESTPFFPQTAYQCGPSALATALGAIGVAADPNRLAQRVFLPARQGSLQVEMIGGARQAGAVPTRIEARLESILLEVAAGHPVVVLQNLGLGLVPAWHYAVVIGYSLPRQQIVLRSGVTRRELLPIPLFDQSWAMADRWGVVVLPPGRWPVTAGEAEVVEASIGFERAAQPDMARLVYSSAVQQFPSNLALTMGLGNTAFASGQLALAADSFESAARQHRSAPAWINLSRTLLKAGLPESAWRTALEAEYLDDPAWRAETTALLRDARAARRRQMRSG